MKKQLVKCRLCKKMKPIKEFDPVYLNFKETRGACNACRKKIDLKVKEFSKHIPTIVKGVKALKEYQKTHITWNDIFAGRFTKKQKLEHMKYMKELEKEAR